MTRGRPPQRFCVNGHDTHVVGRYANYVCRECQRMANRRTKQRKAAGELASMRILSYIKRNGLRPVAGKMYAERHGLKPDSGDTVYYRLVGAPRISLDLADRWCVALGTHIDILYPELALAAEKSHPRLEVLA